MFKLIAGQRSFPPTVKYFNCTVSHKAKGNPSFVCIHVCVHAHVCVSVRVYVMYVRAAMSSALVHTTCCPTLWRIFVLFLFSFLDTAHHITAAPPMSLACSHEAAQYSQPFSPTACAVPPGQGVLILAGLISSLDGRIE